MHNSACLLRRVEHRVRTSLQDQRQDQTNNLRNSRDPRLRWIQAVVRSNMQCTVLRLTNDGH